MSQRTASRTMFMEKNCTGVRMREAGTSRICQFQPIPRKLWIKFICQQSLCLSRPVGVRVVLGSSSFFQNLVFGDPSAPSNLLNVDSHGTQATVQMWTVNGQRPSGARQVSTAPVTVNNAIALIGLACNRGTAMQETNMLSNTSTVSTDRIRLAFISFQVRPPCL